MALNLEEQEQVAELKAWWTRYGGLLSMALVAAALAIGGMQWWRYYQRSQSAQASVLYESLAKGVESGDAKLVREANGALAERYPRTLYASLGALSAARYYFDHSDSKNARAQLQWVLEHAASDDLRDLARLRLAAVLLDDKALDEALKLLDEKHGEAYTGQYAALKGDVLVAKKQIAEAKAAYRVAIERSGRSDGAFRESVRLRLDALGG
jgi:predicted negative regulator of RcsB-dependent stress response